MYQVLISNEDTSNLRDGITIPIERENPGMLSEMKKNMGTNCYIAQ
jgi:hypothetical protein